MQGVWNEGLRQTEEFNNPTRRNQGSSSREDKDTIWKTTFARKERNNAKEENYMEDATTT